MQIVQTIADVREAVHQRKRAGDRVALVPTMGALHAGHLALVDAGRERARTVVASIFVNPLQFGVHEDLAKYPRTLDADLAALRERGVEIVFTPSVEEMYPPERVVSVTAAPHDGTFEGAVRPGHFTGVLTVVAKLLHIVQPDVAVFGQKDAQQLSLIRRMVRDLNMPVDIVAVPTVREGDGLAMSSRNRYLSPDDRQHAVRLSATLSAMRDLFTHGERESAVLLARGNALLRDDPTIAVDYLALVDPLRFEPLIVAHSGAAVILAARVGRGSTRLLDNIIL